MNKNELKVLEILAEIQNPDKRITDMARDLIFLATEKAQGRDNATKETVKANINYYMKHLHDELDKRMDADDSFDDDEGDWITS